MGGRATTGGVALSPEDVGEAKNLRAVVTSWDKGLIAGEVAEAFGGAFEPRHQDTVGGNIDNPCASSIAGVATSPSCTRQ
jgi:hypothetical protein